MLSDIHVSLAASPSPGPTGLQVTTFEHLLAAVDGSSATRTSIGDHQGNNIEMFSGLGYAAARTRRIAVGPTVTNTLNREPAVHAAGLASLDALSGGRAFAVFGRGDGAVRNLGRRPQTVAEFEAAFRHVRALLSSGATEYDGRRVSMRWPTPTADRIPLGVSAAGPRMARLAGALADDAYLSSGVDELAVAEALEDLDAGARAEDRPRPRPWWVTPFGVADDRDRAIEIVGPSLVTLANHSMRPGSYGHARTPESHRAGLAAFHERFDWTKKNVPGAERANVDLMADTGILDHLIDRFAVVGTVDEVVERLTELARRGVDRVMLKTSTLSEVHLLADRVMPRVLHSKDGR